MIRLALAISLLAGSAQAQTFCGERELIVAQLEQRYGETLRSIGLQGEGSVIEVYASGKTGSWTILVSDTAGRSCLLAVGDSFESFPAEKGEPL